MNILSQSAASISSRLDPMSYSALDSRITFLKETKPEVIFWDANAYLTSFGFYQDSVRPKTQVAHYFPCRVEDPVTSEQDIRYEMTRIEAFNKLLLEKPQDMFKRLKYLIRRGISEQHRGTIWKLCLSKCLSCENWSERLEQYQTLLQKEIDQRTVEQINKDIDRTMPQLAFFNNSDYLQSLFCILKAYAASDPQISYCYGMGFIAAVFLYYMPEFDAFYCFSKYMELCGSIYDPSMNGTRRKCQLVYEILKITDRSIYDYFLAVGLEPVTLASWVMTLFLYSLDFQVAVRILDMFVNEGDKAVVRAAIALIRRAACGKQFKIPRGVKPDSQAHCDLFQAWVYQVRAPYGISIIGMPHDDAFIKLNQIGYAVKNADRLVDEMLRVKFKTAQMHEIQAFIAKKIK